MAFLRGSDDSDPIRIEPVTRLAGAHEEERRASRGKLASATLACGRCDAPIALPDGRAAPADPLACPFCGEHGAVRDFLTLGEPTRPNRVTVRVVAPRFARR
jgi:hypothetical protein